MDIEKLLTTFGKNRSTMFDEPVAIKSRCLHCGTEMYGRSDKKFCDTRCKNAYHNGETERSRRYRKSVMAAIEVNYAILDDLLKKRQLTVAVEKITPRGFSPNYSTYHRKKYPRDEYGCFDIRYNRSDSRIYNIHRIGPDIGEP